MFWERKTNQLALIYSASSIALVIGVVFTERYIYLIIPMVIMAYYFYRQRVCWLVIGGLLILICLWRGAIAWPDIGDKTVYKNNGYGKYIGVVLDEPTIKTDKAVLSIGVKEVSRNNTIEKLTGIVQVETSRFIDVKLGDEVEAICKIFPAINLDGSWQKWLVKDGIMAKCSQALVKKIGDNKYFKYSILNKLLWLKQKATTVTKNILPEPYSSLLAGILWGARAGLPDNLQQLMKSAGITHIIAISGYNISLITIALGSWLILIGCSKKQMAVVVGVVLIVFVIITGASASVVRAAVMGGFIVVIKLVQRRARPIVILPLALLMMGLFNPLAIMYDAGLHLSFLATIGLMYVNPLIEKHLPSKTPAWLKESCVTTFSATLMTAPYSWWQFGKLTLAGLISNLVVVPLVPLVMIFGSLAVGAYFVYPILSVPFSFITHILLAAIIWVAQITGDIPSL